LISRSSYYIYSFISAAAIITGVYIYCIDVYLNKLVEDNRGRYICPRNKDFLGDKYKEMGLGRFLG
jgi:hypothetical protein